MIYSLHSTIISLENWNRLQSLTQDRMGSVIYNITEPILGHPGGYPRNRKASLGLTSLGLTNHS